jgi:DnaJ-class molecular chaperone
MLMSREPCSECGDSGNRLTKGDGKCNRCSGSGVDVGVAVLTGYEGDCERCNGTGVCPACNGTGVRPGDG